MKLLVVGFFVFILLSVGFVSAKIITLNCYEKDPLVKLDVQLKYISGELNPFPSGVQPFSQEGLRYAIKFNNWKRNCFDKW